MDLAFCGDCGHYFNRSFQPDLMYYSENYETSLYASGVFRQYADALVQRLLSTYNIRGKQILEIGCGRGEFLRQLCREGGNRGIGFDTSTPVEGEDALLSSVFYVRDYFSADYSDIRADLIVCQQVLEHVENPAIFLRGLAESRAFQAGRPVVYFEVPNGLFTARELGIWDLIYEHISYFTPTSLRRLFEDSGFEVISLGSTYGEQYLYVEARLSGRGSATSDTVRSSVSISQADVETARSFADCFNSKLNSFQIWSQQADSSIEKTWVWGAGSKGITFCNLVDPDGRIAGLIDRSTAKQGKFIAGTGIGIFPLEQIGSSSIVNLVVMNPQYAKEIEADLENAGVGVQIIDAMGDGH